MLGDNMLWTDDDVYGDCIIRKDARVGEVFGGSDSGDLLWGVEQRMCNLARRHVDFILIGHGKNQIGILHAGPFKHARMGCGSCHSPDIEAILKPGKLF